MNKKEIKKELIKFLEWMDCDESDYELSNIEIIDKYLKTIEESEEKSCYNCKHYVFNDFCDDCIDFINHEFYSTNKPQNNEQRRN